MSNGILAIKAAVKSVLADASLGQVSKWLSAEPSPSAYPGLCFGWVEWGAVVQLCRRILIAKKRLMNSS